MTEAPPGNAALDMFPPIGEDPEIDAKREALADEIARELDFEIKKISEEETLFRDAGLFDAQLYHPGVGFDPWHPTTLDDVDWVLWKAKLLELEAVTLVEHAERRAATLRKAQETLLSRYEADCREIAFAALPRRKKDGTPIKKSLVLARTETGFRPGAGTSRCDAGSSWPLSLALMLSWESLRVTQKTYYSSCLACATIDRTFGR